MCNIFKRIISLFLVLSMCFSITVTVAFASVSATLLTLLSAAGYAALTGAAATAGSYAVSSLLSNEVEYYSTDSGSTTYNLANYGDSVTSTGTDYSYVYNGGDTTNYYQTIDTTNNTYYNTYTNTYNEYYDITYNQEYNTYYITEEYYDVYITNNYTYITYVIEDTSTYRTYYYEIYYMLPDGRNSYTLSAEDIWGEYFIYDVVNYDYVAEDDGTTLGLWHLDGDVKDSSYYNSTGSSVESITYQDSIFTYGKYLTGNDLNLSFANATNDFDLFTDDWTLEYIVYNYGSSSGNTFDGLNHFYWNGLEYIVSSLGVYDEFYYCAIVCENGELSFYKNGNLVSYITMDETASCTYYSYYCPVEESYTSVSYYDGLNYYVNTMYVTYFANTDFTITNFGNSFISFEEDAICFDFDERVTATYTSNYSIKTYTDCSNDIYDGWTDTEYYTMEKTYSANSLTTCIIDEVRLSSGVLYDSNYTVSSVPFDTNMVMVVPTDVRENTICVQALYEINDVRIGGVRSTYPVTGDIYVYLEDDVVTSVQQYQENAWYTVEATIYTDGEYADLYGYDMSSYVIYEEDTTDGTTTDDDTSSDGTTTDDSSDGSTGSDSSDSSDSSTSSDSSWISEAIESVFSMISELVAGVINGYVSAVEDIITALDNLFNSLSDLFNIVLDILASMIDCGAEFSGFLGEFFDWLPDEVVSLMCLAVSLPLLLGIIKFVLEIYI